MSELVFLKEVQQDLNTVVTVGTFDGVHRGHRALIDTVIQRSREHGARSVIVTFDPHPRDIINPGSDGIKLLTTLEERCSILADLGIDAMVVIPFTRDFSLLSSEEFIREIIYEKIGVKEFVIGFDHHFGRNREGTIETVQQLGRTLGFGVHVVSKREFDDQKISSTAIRKAIMENGDIPLANELLGWTYRLTGTVIHGDKRGASIGFPTANIKPDHPNKAIPKNGVYAVRTKINGDEYGGMMNIGVRPTFTEEEEATLEVHLFDFDDNIYGKSLEIFFEGRIRDEQKFDGIEAIKRQLKEDKRIAESILN
ncbi:MAG: bifunctional riboflavin kinase/FAD synthetase [Bacteroidota bacterium]